MDQITELKDNDKHIYQELGQNIRHYSQLRMVAMTVFVAATLGIGAINYHPDFKDAPKFVKFAVQFLGIIVTTIFYLYDRRLGVYVSHFQKFAAQFEKDSNFRHCPWAELVVAEVTYATRAIQSMYIVFWFLWLIAIIQSSSSIFFNR